MKGVSGCTSLSEKCWLSICIAMSYQLELYKGNLYLKGDDIVHFTPLYRFKDLCSSFSPLESRMANRCYFTLSPEKWYSLAIIPLLVEYNQS